jgi:copper chaperone CopZ
MTTVADTELQSVELPLAGMTCAACAARIEKQLNKLPGVEAAVNFATERATIRYATAGTTAAKLVETIRKTGFEVPPATLDLAIGGMTCAACATRIEKQLNKLEGVEAAVNLAAERAHIRYVPGLADPERLVATVVKTGFTATVSSRRHARRGKGAQARRVSRGAAPLLDFRRADAAAGGADGLHVRTGCTCRRPAALAATVAWRRRCSSGSAGASMSAVTTRSAAAPATWTCWWRSAPPWPGPSASWSRWPTCTTNMCTTRRRPRLLPWCCWARSSKRGPRRKPRPQSKRWPACSPRPRASSAASVTSSNWSMCRWRR